MNEKLTCMIEEVVYKMVSEGKLFVQKTCDDNGNIKLSLNVVLEDEEKDKFGNNIKYVANPEGKNGVFLYSIKNRGKRVDI